MVQALRVLQAVKHIFSLIISAAICVFHNERLWQRIEERLQKCRLLVHCLFLKCCEPRLSSGFTQLNQQILGGDETDNKCQLNALSEDISQHCTKNDWGLDLDPDFQNSIVCFLKSNCMACFRFKDGEQKLVEGVEEKWDDAKESMHHFGKSTDRCKPDLWDYGNPQAQP